MDKERKFVTVRKVTAIEPINGADFIELAHIDGWQCIVLKNKFKVGDLGIYFEIGSGLKVSKYSDFESFLGKCTKTLEDEYGDTFKVYHIKTIKLRETFSQGLLLPLSDMKDLIPTTIDEDTDLGEMDVVDYDGIREMMDSMKGYNPECVAKELNPFIKVLDFLIMKIFRVRLFGNRMMPRPQDIDSTSCNRIENRITRLNQTFNGNLGTVEVSIKYDGQAHHVWLDSKGETVQSYYSWYNDNQAKNPKYFKQLLKVTKFKEFIRYCEEKLNTKVVLQGELVGPGINKNRHEQQGYTFILYNIFDRKTRTSIHWTKIVELVKECIEWSNIFYVQYKIYDNFQLDMEYIKKVFDEMQEEASTQYVIKDVIPHTQYNFCNNIRNIEGIVIKYESKGIVSRLKYINPKYLLKFDD